MRYLLCRKSLVLGAAVVALSLGLAGAAVADDIAVTGRNIATQWKDTVVHVELVLKMKRSYNGETQTKEMKGTGIGVVIDPSGLVVLPFAAINPTESGSDGDGSDSDIKSEITSIKIRLGDGINVPYKVVLRDKDLDLAFIKPVNKLPNPVAAVDLKNSTSTDVLSRVMVLHRLDKIGGYALAATLQRVNAIIEKPRKCYTITMSNEGSQYGGPVFSMDGKIIGLLLTRSIGSSDSDDSSLTVILPAEDINEVAVQVLEDAPKDVAKEDEPSTPTEEKKPEN